MLKPEFSRFDEGAVLESSRRTLHAQEQSFRQRESDWRTDLRDSMEREEQFRSRLRELEEELRVREKPDVSLSIGIEQKRQRIQELESEVQGLVAQLDQATDVSVKMRRVAISGCDWVECSDERYGGWRFCKFHLGVARKEMREDGYLQSVPWQGGGNRTPEMMENVRETKDGPVE